MVLRSRSGWCAAASYVPSPHALFNSHASFASAGSCRAGTGQQQGLQSTEAPTSPSRRQAKRQEFVQSSPYSLLIETDPTVPGLTAFVIIFLVLTTIFSASFATAVVVVLITAALTAIVTAVRTTALVPDRVGHYVQSLHRRRWVVAHDHQFARNRALLGGLVSNHHTQT